MQSGKAIVTLQKTGTGGGVTEVVFSTPFDNVPNVVLTPQYAASYIAAATLSAVDNTKFGVLLRSDVVGTTSQRDVYWTAIDPTQPPLIAA